MFISYKILPCFLAFEAVQRSHRMVDHNHFQSIPIYFSNEIAPNYIVRLFWFFRKCLNSEGDVLSVVDGTSADAVPFSSSVLTILDVSD